LYTNDEAGSREAAAASDHARWHDKYFEDCGDGTACIRDGARRVSEGIGYGMLRILFIQTMGGTFYVS
jgi:hypothetical protein